MIKSDIKWSKPTTAGLDTLDSVTLTQHHRNVTRGVSVLFHKDHQLQTRIT
jgi:hypothetical protein